MYRLYFITVCIHRMEKEISIGSEICYRFETEMSPKEEKERKDLQKEAKSYSNSRIEDDFVGSKVGSEQV